MNSVWKGTNIAMMFALLAFVGCQSASSPSQAQSGKETRDDIYLTFTLDGGEFNSEELDIKFGTNLRSRNVNYWISYEPQQLTTGEIMEKTAFSFEGRHDDWHVDMDFEVPMRKLGSHEFHPDEFRNFNVNFYFYLQAEGEDQRTRYNAQSAQVELIDYDEKYITGTFHGRFVKGMPTASTPEEEREYVTISDGRFKINWAEGQSSTTKTKW